MKHEDFRHRTISMTDGPLKVLRTRTSAGHVSIAIEYDKLRLTFSDIDYERNIIKLIDMMDTIVADQCALTAPVDSSSPIDSTNK